MATEIVLVRHGETEWSRDGRHTGNTDVPLTERGMEQAQALGAALEGRSFIRVLTSPLSRAGETARLAVLAELRTVEGAALVFAHGHLLRVLAVRWIGLEPDAGRLLALDPATVSVLGYERETPVIRVWNASIM